jgi:hypothetical protein
MESSALSKVIERLPTYGTLLQITGLEPVFSLHGRLGQQEDVNEGFAGPTTQ